MVGVRGRKGDISETKKHLSRHWSWNRDEAKENMIR